MITSNVGKILILLFTGSLLWSCGGGDEPADNSSSADSAKSSVASESSSSKSSKRSCPAKPSSSPRADGKPVDDVIGIRNGMSLDDVVWILECRDDIDDVETAEKWTVKQTHGFPIRQLVRGTNGTECTSQELVKEIGSYGGSKKCSDGGYRFKPKKDITHQVAVTFMGMPGEEKVGAVWRRNIFAEGSYPTKEALLKSITDKYGEPHHQHPSNNPGNPGAIVWTFDPNLDRPLSKSSPAFNGCVGYANPVFESSHVWNASCGVTISVGLKPVYGNELLVRELNIGIMDQKSLYEMGEAFNADLAAALEKRKQEEAAAAAGNVGTPDL